MKFSESIYEGVVTPYYKKITWEVSNRNGLSRNKGEESASSNTHPTKYESSVKRRKRYIDRLKRASKNCMIHCLWHSSYWCSFWGKFGTEYAAAQLTKYCGINPIPKKGFRKKQDNHTIIDNMVDQLNIVESKT